MTAEPIDHLVLDWNGTLIDDVGIAVEGVNFARSRQGLAEIDRQTYRAAFGFPIQDFYQRLGFDFERQPFEEVVQSYLGLFNGRIRDCTLHAGALSLIAQARGAGMTVSVLSASNQDVLAETIEHFDLTGLFDRVMGLSDEQAVSKIDLAGSLDRDLGRPGRRVLMVGDTDHDQAVAEAHGWLSVIVTHGHQAADRFDRSRLTVFDDFSALALWLAGKGSSK